MSQGKERLKEIREEMFSLLDEAASILKDVVNDKDSFCGSTILLRAECYWLSHIACALGHENYPTISCTFKDTLEEIDTVENLCADEEEKDTTPTGY